MTYEYGADYYSKDCAAKHSVPRDHYGYVSTGMSWALEHGPKYRANYVSVRGQSERQCRCAERRAKRRMKRDCRAHLKNQYGMGPIASLFLWAILQRIASIIVNYWWKRWGLPESND